MNLVWTACVHGVINTKPFNVNTAANIVFHVICFEAFLSLHIKNSHLRFEWGTGLKMRKILNGHCVKGMQQITAMFKKILCTVCSTFTLNDVSPQSILWFCMYCTGKEKKNVKNKLTLGHYRRHSASPFFFHIVHDDHKIAYLYGLWSGNECWIRTTHICKWLLMQAFWLITHDKFWKLLAHSYSSWRLIFHCL
jgi:hypothetical protein